MLAGIGELLEAGAGAAGTKMGGGSSRGMLGAIVGGLVGAIVCTPLIPIPVLGTLIGALIIGVIRNGMNLTGVEAHMQSVVYGVVILIAVLVDQLKAKLR